MITTFSQVPIHKEWLCPEIMLRGMLLNISSLFSLQSWMGLKEVIQGLVANPMIYTALYLKGKLSSHGWFRICLLATCFIIVEAQEPFLPSVLMFLVSDNKCINIHHYRCITDLQKPIHLGKMTWFLFKNLSLIFSLPTQWNKRTCMML